MVHNYKPPIHNQLAVIAETIHRDDGIETARDNVPGQSYEYKFGHQDAISNVEIQIWDVAEAYVYQAAALPIFISSNDANDQATGTGARTVSIFGLDANYDEINEEVTLLSTTAVTTTNSYLRVFRLQVNTAGTGEKNAGILYAGASTVTAGVPADKYAAIIPGENQTLMSLWTVPAGKTAYIKRILTATAEATADRGAVVRLKIRELNKVFRTSDKFDLVREVISVKHWAGIPVPEKSDIQMTAIRSGNTDLGVAGSFELMIRDN